MTEEDGITVSIPHYHHEFTMSWMEHRESTLGQFLLRAVAIATDETPFARYAGLIRTPAFGIYVPGQPTLSLDALVGATIQPGNLVLILTDAEARGFLSQEPQGPSWHEMRRSHMTASQFSTAARTPQLREQLVVLNALLGGMARRPQPQPRAASDSDEDEEYVQPQAPLLNPAELMQTIMGTRIQAVSQDRVKKVINLETYNRLCTLVSSEDIRSRTTEAPQAVLDTEDDTIGGPQDAGLGGCSVCLSLLVNRTKDPGELRKMPNCGHIFHALCLQEWLTRNAITCPVCREPAVTEEKDYGYLGLGVNPEAFTPATSVRESATRAEPSWLPDFPPRRTSN